MTGADAAAAPAARPKAVLFDCDGVLVDSEPIADRIIAANLGRYGVAVAPHEVGALFTGGTMRDVELWARARAPHLPTAWRDELYAELFVALETVAHVPGVEAVLDALDAADVPYAVGSNGPLAKMAVSLRVTGLAPRFGAHVYSAHTLGAWKPAPDVYLHAAAALGVAPAEAAVVGDSLADAQAAAAGGMRCFGYVGRVSAEAFRAHGAEPFAHMAELPARLGL